MNAFSSPNYAQAMAKGLEDKPTTDMKTYIAQTGHPWICLILAKDYETAAEEARIELDSLNLGSRTLTITEYTSGTHTIFYEE
jgi:hypothetical protein